MEIRERKCVRASGRDRAYPGGSSFEDSVPYRSSYGSRVTVDDGGGEEDVRGACVHSCRPGGRRIISVSGPVICARRTCVYLRSPAPKVVTNLEREIPARRFRAESQRWRRVALATRGKRREKARERERERERERVKGRYVRLVGVDEWRAVSHDHAKVIWVIWGGEVPTVLRSSFIMVFRLGKGEVSAGVCCSEAAWKRDWVSSQRLHQRRAPNRWEKRRGGGNTFSRPFSRNTLSDRFGSCIIHGNCQFPSFSLALPRPWPTLY